MPACVQMVLNVDAFKRGWLGIVSGLCVPSGLSRAIEMCSLSRTKRKPSDSNAPTTRRRGASTGNCVTTIRRLLPPRSFQYSGLRIEGLGTEGFPMEGGGRFQIGHRLFVGIPFSHHNTLDPQWVRHVPVLVLLYNELYSTCFAHGAPGWQIYWGIGLLNILPCCHTIAFRNYRLARFETELPSRTAGRSARDPRRGGARSRRRPPPRPPELPLRTPPARWTRRGGSTRRGWRPG